MSKHIDLPIPLMGKWKFTGSDWSPKHPYALPKRPEEMTESDFQAFLSSPFPNKPGDMLEVQPWVRLAVPLPPTPTYRDVFYLVFNANNAWITSDFLGLLERQDAEYPHGYVKTFKEKGLQWRDLGNGYAVLTGFSLERIKGRRIWRISFDT